MSRFTRLATLVLVLSGAVVTTMVAAEPFKIEMRLSNPQQLRIDFPLVGAEKHFVTFVKPEGTAAAGSTWAGAKVQEVGLHDVFPGDRVTGMGYITFTFPNGDQVSMKHEFNASFLPTADGKMAPVDHGVWTILAGTGTHVGVRGVGHFQFKPVPDNTNDRVWELTGDIAVLGKK